MSVVDDPFARLGLPRRFGVRDAEIRERLRVMLAGVHPDREPDPVRRAMTLRDSAAISAAARRLLDPRDRAESLLRAAGVEPAPPPPPSLLLEMLEWTERVDEALATKDASAIDACIAEVRARRENLLGRMEESFDHAEGGEGVAAAEMLTELRLVDRLLERALRA